MCAACSTMHHATLLLQFTDQVSQLTRTIHSHSLIFLSHLPIPTSILPHLFQHISISQWRCSLRSMDRLRHQLSRLYCRCQRMEIIIPIDGSSFLIILFQLQQPAEGPNCHTPTIGGRGHPAGCARDQTGTTQPKWAVVPSSEPHIPRYVVAT